jgi:alkylated DNA repair dioxygenase AlkB
MDICLCGWYANGKKKIGWHRDREELGNQTPIASISLGAERLFEFRENNATEVSINYPFIHPSTHPVYTYPCCSCVNVQ